MKIICTQKEQDALCNNTEALCPVVMVGKNVCTHGDCIACVLNNIEWEITDED